MSETETIKQVEQAEQEQPAQEESKKKRWFGKKEKVKKTPLQELREWVVTLAVALVIAFVVRSFLFEPVRVDGSSMATTLTNGEVMFVTKPEYLMGDPERFDVVICHYPGRGNTNFVKRVVGLPGDTIEMVNGVLIVNGQIYEEPYIQYRSFDSLAPLTLAEDEYFVMGDNRANSNDSRNDKVGPITRDMIVGHVRSVLWPLDKWRTIE